MAKNTKVQNTVLPTFASERHVDVECVLHMHLTLEIVLVTEGVLDMRVGDKEYHIVAGEGLFVAPLEPHSFHSGKKNKCHVLMFQRELVGHFYDYLSTHKPTCHIFTPSKESLSLCEKLLPERYNVTGPLVAEACLAPLCYDILTGCHFERRERSFENALTRAIEYMDAHFTEDVTLESVAHATGQHPVTLSKSFPRYSSMSFHQYLQYLRTSYAVRLIQREEMTLTEIAYLSGFGSVRSFNRAFLSVYGMVPSRYRESENTLII